MELNKDSLINYIKNTELFDIQRDTVLLAISGGLDSVVLAHLFRAAGVNFAMAHCNFQLRGAESDGDAEFVRQLAIDWQIPFFEVAFDTPQYMQAQGLSVQVAARELRYDWLEKIREDFDYQYIAMAHHLNDSIETFFMNVLKGCGIHGIQGIRNKNLEKKVVRPLSFASRTQIVQYAENQQITHREDSSNATNNYRRNQIRNMLLPLLHDFQPQLENTFEGNFERWQDAEWLYNWGIAQWKSQVSEQRGAALWIDKSKLIKIPIHKTLLFELLQPYYFNIYQTEDILKLSQAGTWVDSSSHRLLCDRDFWILQPLANLNPSPEKIEIVFSAEEGYFELGTAQLTYKIYAASPSLSFDKSPKFAYLDADKLSKSLELRAWKSGDFFHPLGMKGQSKTVKKFLKDQKVNLYEKAKLWILTSKGQIVWLLGQRSDERFKVEEKTTRIICLQFELT